MPAPKKKSVNHACATKNTSGAGLLLPELLSVSHCPLLSKEKKAMQDVVPHTTVPQGLIR
jgi:hypothetical protein